MYTEQPVIFPQTQDSPPYPSHVRRKTKASFRDLPTTALTSWRSNASSSKHSYCCLPLRLECVFSPHTRPKHLLSRVFTFTDAFFLASPQLSTPHRHINGQQMSVCSTCAVCAVSCCSTIKITGSSVGVVREWQSTKPSVILGCWQVQLISSKFIDGFREVRYQV